MIDLRPIDPVARAAAIVKLWNRRAGASFPLDERLLLQQLRMERGPSLCIGAFEAGRRGAEEPLAGVALVKGPRPAQAANSAREGFLSFIVVDEAASRRGVGTALLGAAEGWLAGQAATSLRFGRDRYHFFPGLPIDGSPASEALGAFLAARGFETEGSADDHDLVADLSELDLPGLARRSPLAPGFRFQLYESGLREATEAFLLREFPGRWRDEFLEGLEAGMREGDLALLIEEETGEVAGFSRVYDGESPLLGGSMYWRGLMGSSPGGLGPIGVASSLRGRGLGLALLRLCVEELAQRDVRLMAIDWTTLDGFYGKLGFRPWKTYRPCRKRLGAGEA
jgi:GNAT superfamily N-acetyltransferase